MAGAGQPEWTQNNILGNCTLEVPFMWFWPYECPLERFVAMSTPE